MINSDQQQTKLARLIYGAGKKDTLLDGEREPSVKENTHWPSESDSNRKKIRTSFQAHHGGFHRRPSDMIIGSEHLLPTCTHGEMRSLPAT